MKNSTTYLIVTILTFITGFIFLRVAYFETLETPYAQEIVLIVLGTIATLAVTAALINKQSEVELQKEQRVKLFDLKSDLYLALINFIEGIITKETISREDLVTLEFITHKISIIAHPEVLQEYTGFLTTVKQTAQDHKISVLESDELSKQLASLCARIRHDLLLNEENSTIDMTSLLQKNVAKL